MKFNREYLKNIHFIVNTYDKIKETYSRFFISDSDAIKKRFSSRVGREVELANPIKYNDKLQWLKLNWDDPIASKCADKFLVREVVEERIGSEYLNKIHAVYNSVEEIDIESLPNQFVLKGTHGSGYNIICSDKNKTDWKIEFNKMRRWMNQNYFWTNREPVYKNTQPRIICEQFLVQDDEIELRDYRFFCFEGEPKFITVDFSITDKSKTRRNLYDLDWNLMDAEISYPKETTIKVKKPEKLKEMIELSHKLSAGFPHARIDFYYINNKIIFGEITFFHQNGMGRISPDTFETTMGSWIKLPLS